MYDQIRYLFSFSLYSFTHFTSLTSSSSERLESTDVDFMYPTAVQQALHLRCHDPKIQAVTGAQAYDPSLTSLLIQKHI